MDLVSLGLWNLPYILLPLLGFAAIRFVPKGRRLMPAVGQVLLVMSGVVGLLAGGAMAIEGRDIEYRPVAETVIGLIRYADQLLLVAGFAVLLISVLRRTPSGSAHRPASAYGGPPPAAPGGPGPYDRVGLGAPSGNPNAPGAGSSTGHDRAPQDRSAYNPPVPGPPPTGGGPYRQPPGGPPRPNG